MNPAVWAIAGAAGLFMGVLACLELGYRVGRRQAKNPELAQEGIGAVEQHTSTHGVS